MVGASVYHLNTRPSYNHNGKQACMHHACTHASNPQSHVSSALPAPWRNEENRKSPPHLPCRTTATIVPFPLPSIIPPYSYPNHPTQNQIHPRTYLLTLHCLSEMDKWSEKGIRLGEKKIQYFQIGHHGLENPTMAYRQTVTEEFLLPMSCRI